MGSFRKHKKENETFTLPNKNPGETAALVRRDVRVRSYLTDEFKGG